MIHVSCTRRHHFLGLTTCSYLLDLNLFADRQGNPNRNADFIKCGMTSIVIINQFVLGLLDALSLRIIKEKVSVRSN